MGDEREQETADERRRASAPFPPSHVAGLDFLFIVRAISPWADALARILLPRPVFGPLSSPVPAPTPRPVLVVEVPDDDDEDGGGKGASILLAVFDITALRWLIASRKSKIPCCKGTCRLRPCIALLPKRRSPSRLSSAPTWLCYGRSSMPWKIGRVEQPPGTTGQFVDFDV